MLSWCFPLLSLQPHPWVRLRTVTEQGSYLSLAPLQFFFNSSATENYIYFSHEVSIVFYFSQKGYSDIIAMQWMFCFSVWHVVSTSQMKINTVCLLYFTFSSHAITFLPEFFDLELGISDPEVYTRPSTCMLALPEHMDSDWCIFYS